MKKTILLWTALLSGSSALAQTVPLPILEAPVAAVPVVDAGVTLDAPAMSAAEGPVAPLAMPVDSLSTAAPLQSAAPLRRSGLSMTPIVRKVRSAAMASIVAAATALGLPACEGNSPVADAGTDAGYQYPNPYISYPNGHPLAVLAPNSQTTLAEDDMYNAVNAWRSQNGLGPVIPSQTLSDMARANSQHMPMHEYFSSQNPEGDGPSDRARKVQIVGTDVSEGIAKGGVDGGGDPATQILASNPSLTQAIGIPGLNRVGAGLFVDPQLGPYWTLDLINDPSFGDAGIGYTPFNDAGVQPLIDAGAGDGGLPPLADAGTDDGGE